MVKAGLPAADAVFDQITDDQDLDSETRHFSLQKGEVLSGESAVIESHDLLIACAIILVLVLVAVVWYTRKCLNKNDKYEPIADGVAESVNSQA